MLWSMTLGNVLGMGGITGAILIVVTFYLWFFLSQFPPRPTISKCK